MCCVLFLSCKKDIVYEFEYEIIQEDIMPDCAIQSCPQVSVSLLKIQKPLSVSMNVKGILEKDIIQILEEEGQESQDIAQAMANYINNIQTGYPEETSIAGLNEVTITTEVASTSNILLSVVLDYYKYSGGAHGYGEVYYYNFNPQTGALYSGVSYFKNKEAFLNLAKSKFLKKYNLRDSDALSSKGFFFKDDKFHLPKQIGFTDAEIILLYNPYEIAPYSEGQIELRIPKKEATRFLNFF